MKKDLFLRTDVLPAELPILFSNKPVYLGFSKKNFDSEKFMNVVTVPYYYFIPKSNKERRKMSLVHPIAQLQMFQYILKYEDLVTSFCRNSQYSVRAPIKRNIPKTSEQELRVKEILKLEEEFSLVDKISVTSEEDKILFYNYFTYRRYTRIKDLYSSPKFNRDKYKYKFFLKLDIQQFFPSIYTHSLSWALFGDKSVAKKYKGNLYKSAFPNASDMIAQIINFNETHGLIIGPEFSRIIAELLLTRVDIDLHARLREENLYNKKNYSIYRYVDDYFLFASKKEDILYIEECLKGELNKYNLSLNVHKSMLQEKPFRISGGPILKLKIILREFKQDKKLAFDLKKEKEPESLLLFSEYKGSINQWNNLFNRV
ncbi:TPA: RNA-directed DNA polymerase, partial [Listeria innocua]|nr:RNA-directed DNA polymerase [Listeria innocua]